MVWILLLPTFLQHADSHWVIKKRKIDAAAQEIFIIARTFFLVIKAQSLALELPTFQHDRQRLGDLCVLL